MVSSRWNRTLHPWERTRVSAAPRCFARPLEASKIYSAGRVSNGPDGDHGHRAAGPERRMAARVRLLARKKGLRVTERACGQDVRRRTVEQGSMQDLFSLTGKVAVVTGATGVLGGEMARSLARSGARVAVLGRREEKAPPGRRRDRSGWWGITRPYRRRARYWPAPRRQRRPARALGPGGYPRKRCRR